MNRVLIPVDSIARVDLLLGQATMLTADRFDDVVAMIQEAMGIALLMAVTHPTDRPLDVPGVARLDARDCIEQALRERMNSGACSSFSSRRTCWVRAEGVMKSRSAAFVRLFSSAMATTYSNSFRFIKHPSGVLRCSCRAVSAKSARYDTIIHDFGRSVQKKEENCLGI